MTVEQISSLKKFIISQQNHWVFFCVLYFFMVVMSTQPMKPGLPLLIWFTIGCFPFLFYMVKKATNNTVAFWGVHVAAFLFAVLIPTPNMICTVAYAGCTALYCIHSLTFRYSGEGEEDKEIPILVSFGITFALLLLLQFFREYDSQRIFVNLLVWNIFFVLFGSLCTKLCEFYKCKQAFRWLYANQTDIPFGRGRNGNICIHYICSIAISCQFRGNE